MTYEASDRVKTELEYNFNENELRKWKCYSFDRLGKISNVISNALSFLQRNCQLLKIKIKKREGSKEFISSSLLM